MIPKDVETRVVGSVVRGTQLRGESDVDIFLLFSKKHKRDKITKDGLEYAKKIVKKSERFEIKYAEHPYARLYLDKLGVEADIVPAFNIDNIEDMSTSVDRSPMHADFINAHLTEKQRDEVRLLKYLLIRQNLYGAEVRVGGFSGYLCELLIYHYGSLANLLENATMFMPPMLLDPKNKVALHDLGLVKKFNSMFVVIDPVDPNRNVAAGVSTDSLAKFVLVARAFISDPSAVIFQGKRFASGKAADMLDTFVKNSGLDMYVLATKIPDKTEDVVWPQLRKVAEFIVSHSEKFGFRVYISLPIVFRKQGLLTFFAPKEILKTRINKGPIVFMRKAQEEFSDAHKNAIGTLIQDGKMYSLDKNRYENLEELMKDVGKGSMMKGHKDITLRGSKLFVNKIPKEYAEAIYFELMKKLGS